MDEITITPKVDAIGRIMIPKAIRDKMGIAQGDLVEITVRKKELHDLL
jgi:AbrB family looped-hinge helix DNA binding protein